ncbi:MAG: hypothetical protein CBB66_05900 [bacterium TMED6]|nr:MAG: hypothetical protein CBB66_05900 [bacterium TMED6]|tara:strand:- start:3642 stop:4304 length:663 start_codon:yes stop_codon:yes gene_type:complete
MRPSLFFGIVCLLIFVSCNNKSESVVDSFEDIDILKHADISISKGDQKIVNAVASKLLKDETYIFLKANYNEIKSSEIRSKLSQIMIESPSYSSLIRNLALDLHNNDGNVRAEFYGKDQEVVSSILYSDSAQINNRHNNMVAEGNVIIYSPTTNLMLLGNKVLWDNRAKRILSDDNVTIVKITEGDKSPCIQKSIGFESDMDLSNYIFYNIKGQIGEDCF